MTGESTTCGVRTLPNHVILSVGVPSRMEGISVVEGPLLESALLGGAGLQACMDPAKDDRL